MQAAQVHQLADERGLTTQTTLEPKRVVELPLYSAS